MTRPETGPADAGALVRRISIATRSLAGYFVALWAAHFALVEEGRDDVGMHVFWALGVVVPLGLVHGVRQRSPYSLHMLVRTSFGGAIGGVGWIAIEVGGGHHREAAFVWICAIIAGAVPVAAYVWWLATRPAVADWVRRTPTSPETDESNLR